MIQAIKQSPNYKWWAFGVITIGIFISFVSQSSAIVAMPSIARHFSADLSTVQWVVLANILATSVLLLPMGRLADIIGRKQVYVVGLTIFILASALAGFATDIKMLIGARALQGVGVAMIQANMTAMIISIFPESERGKAIGLQASVMGSAILSGPALGGLLVSALDWRSIFLITIPISIIGIAAAVTILDKSRFVQDTQGGQRPRFDWLGAVLSGGVLLVLLLSITMANRSGWSSGPIVAGLAASAALLVAFIWWELRTKSPMLNLGLLKRKLVAFGITTGWMFAMGPSLVAFLFPFYLQDVQGYSPAEMGLFIIAAAGMATIIGPFSGRLSDRFGWRRFNMAGLAMMATSLLTISFVLTETSPAVLILLLLAGMGIGAGLFNAPNQSSILSAVERAQYGVISALIQLARTSGNVISVAVATAIVVATMGSMGVEPSLDVISTDGGAEVAHAFVSGMRRAFMVIGSLLLVGIVLSFLQGERAKEPAPEEAALRPNPAESTED